VTTAAKEKNRLRMGIFLIGVLVIMTATAIPIKEAVVPARYHLDKLVHVGMFAMLAGIGLRAVRVRTFLLAAGAVAVLSEFQQAFIPGRCVALLDLVANLVGTGLGLVIFGRRRIRRERLPGGAQ